MKTKGHDYTTIIVWASALVGMIRYAAAFLSSDLGMITGALSEFVTLMLGISGFFMGILGTLGTAYIFDGWRQKIPATGNAWSNKFKVLTVFVFASFLCEILILVPFTMSRIRHVSIADVLGHGDWWWSTVITIMPILLIGGVSVGNQIVTVGTGQMTGQMTGGNGQKEDNQRAKSIPTDWRKAKKELTAPQIAAIAKSQTATVMKEYNLSERTARRWIENAKAENVPPPFPMPHDKS